MADTAAVIPHVVVFADLSPRAKVHYTRFLLEHDVKFQQRASDNRFVANIRLVQPPSVNPGDNQDGRNQEPADEGVEIAHPVDKRLAAVPDALRAYASLIFLIGERPPRASAGPGTYVKETRLVRFINEVYDARYEDMSASCMSSCGSFAKFIRHYLTNRFGLKRLVDQQAWDLIEGLNALQHGKYPESTLAFFLFARSSLQRVVCAPAYRPMSVKTSSGSDRKRKPAPSTSSLVLWLSRTQAETLAETVFGSKTEDTYIEFMHAMKAFLSCDSSIVRARTPGRLLDANEFLFIATETYHKASPSFPSTRTLGGSLRSSPKKRSAAPFAVDKPQTSAFRPPELLGPTSTGQTCVDHPPDTPSSTGAAAGGDHSDDDRDDEAQLQSRLGSLLARVKKRQQSGGS